MKKIQYGEIPTKEKIRHSLFVSTAMLLFVGDMCLILIWGLFEDYFPYSSALALLIVIGCPLIYFYKQHKENKQLIEFDEEGYTIYQYPNQLYLSIFQKKEPKKEFHRYDESAYCKLSYEKADSHHHNAYVICINFEGKQPIRLLPGYLSKTNLKYLLLLLSSKNKQFEDPYQLQLCLTQEHVQIDTYIHRIEEGFA